MKHRVPLAVGFDVFVVVAFVAIGRRNHDEHPGLTGLIETAAPFLIGLALAWAASRAWRDPNGLITGARVWVVTVAAGMLARRFILNEGTAASFVVVTAIFLGTFLVGWRAIAHAMTGRRAT
jgi:Protein of unknown function (DUF3054)